jgi:hypothetical protein
MLDKAVAAVKADRDMALGMFNKGEGGFKDRDLYPFCARISDGRNVASPLYAPIGTDAHTIKDSTGKLYGLEQLAAAQKPEGQLLKDLYGSKTGHHHTGISEGHFHDEGRRSDLWRGLLQIGP